MKKHLCNRYYLQPGKTVAYDGICPNGEIGTLYWRICIILKIQVGRGALNEESKGKYQPVSNISVPIQWTKDT